MKKTIVPIVIALLLVCFALLLFGCNSIPDGVSDDIYNWSRKVIEVSDDYYDSNISNRDACLEIIDLQFRIKDFDLSNGMTSEAELTEQEQAVYDKISDVYMDIRHSAAFSELLKHRNELANLLNMPER